MGLFFYWFAGSEFTSERFCQYNNMDNTLHRAKVLFDKGNRETILEFLQEIDPKGNWTDRESYAEGLEPLTYDEALIELQDVIEELEAEVALV